MNKTVIFIVGGGLVALLLVGAIIVEVLGIKDSNLIDKGMIALGFITSFAILLGANNSQEKKLDKIQKQTNGSLTKRDEIITHQTVLLAENGIHPTTGEPITESIPLTRREYQAANE